MKSLTILLFSLLSLHLFSKDAYFVFKNYQPVEGIGAEGAYKIYDAYTVTVNGTSILQHDKKYPIEINPLSLDTIVVKNLYNGQYSDTVFTKLRTGVTYAFTFNMCSSYEIIPSKTNDGIMLIRLISINRDSTTMFFSAAYSFIDSHQIRGCDTTQYFHNTTSGMCHYAVATFDLCSKEDHSTSAEYQKYCNGISLYFSGREMYSLIYDYTTGKMTAKFEGYYSKGLGVVIGY